MAPTLLDLPVSLLPFLAVGFEIPPGMKMGTIDAPRWIVDVEHQYGGYACLQVGLLGVVLRMEANYRRAIAPDPADLVEGLRAIGESGDRERFHRLSRDAGGLTDLAPTHGDPYPPSELKLLEDTVATWFRLPTLESGHEGFALFSPADPLHFFEGWQVFTPGEEGDPLTDDQVFDDLAVDTLAQAARDAGLAGKPRIFLFWENSD